jgi:sulfur carrier protein
LQLIVNGERVESSAATLADLLHALGFGEATVATALNGDFVPNRARAAVTLSPQDKIEIVSPRQGG